MRDWGAHAVKVVALSASVAAVSLAGLTGAAAGHGPACANESATASSITVSELRDAVACLVQKERATHGRSRLDTDHRLQKAAQDHTDVMLEEDCPGHKCPGEPSEAKRIKRSGYLAGASQWSYTENVGYGATPLDIVNEWMSDPAHRANILRADLEDFGVGAGMGSPVKGRDDSQYVTATVDLGERSPR
jgi:uncharacterized protein YkwD